jgi:hypothetical protein
VGELTPEQRRDAWARTEAFQGFREGWLPEDRIDEYAALLAKSLQGQAMALRFALNDFGAAFVAALPEWIKRRLG